MYQKKRLDWNIILLRYKRSVSSKRWVESMLAFRRSWLDFRACKVVFANSVLRVWKEQVLLKNLLLISIIGLKKWYIKDFLFAF